MHWNYEVLGGKAQRGTHNMFACFVDNEKVFDLVNWKKLMKISTTVTPECTRGRGDL